jgi:ABC-type nitrate/sulfonate/bicarbonate transport system substrate-binding protein
MGTGALLLLPTLSTILAACGGDEAEAREVLFQLGWIKSVQFGGHFAALENGFFDDVNIVADFRSGGPTIDPITAVAANDANFADHGTNSIIAARGQGIPIVAIAAMFQKDPFSLMSLAESPINSVEDMVGRTVAIPDTERLVVGSLLEDKGLSAEDVTFVPVGTDPSILPTGQVDGYFGYSTNQGIILETLGVDINVLHYADMGVPGYTLHVLAREDYLENNHDLVVEWLRADIRGWQWAVENPDEIARLMVEKYGTEGLDIEAQTAEANAQIELITSGLAAEKGIGWMSMDTWSDAMELSAKVGLIEETYPIEDVVTLEFLEEAYGDNTSL